MAIDKSWMTIENRKDSIYIEGVETFLRYAYRFKSPSDVIQCPCKKCRNISHIDESTVRFHLLKYGITTTYNVWYFHGESPDEELHINDDPKDNDNDNDDDMIGLINDIYHATSVENESDSNSMLGGPTKDAVEFYRLLNEAKEKLHPECDLSKLATIMKLLHMKSFHKWTNKSFDDLLGLLREITPNGKQNLPESYNSAKKYIRHLGLHYEKYDVCENHCTLYWGEFANATSCLVCGLSRWKSGDSSNDNKKIPHKVLRYFPLKQRLQRLFMSSEMAAHMRWHKEKRVDDGIMRHPADSPAWKSFDEQHTLFASDPRNVRMGLATDGFQPFGNMSSQHSIWPVILIPYNLPPWLCMKQSNLIVSMIIPGPHSPGMGIDIFLQPLIAELKELWVDGVESYDAHSKQNFTLRASLIWTVNDFPAYADLSGWSTKGYKACPHCHKDTSATYLPHSKKLCYTGHRKYLSRKHKWRKDTNSFNGLTEMRKEPRPLSGDDVLKEFDSFTQLPFNRGVKRKYDSSNSFENWRKKSIFFELPYWRTLLIRHILDVMHIEKNVCDNILATLMKIKGKTKDDLNSRKDLKSMGIRPKLHPTVVGDKIRIPLARYVLSENDKTTLCKMLADLETPDGYLSKICRCVNVKERKISGMKSHDCHVFLQKLLPIAIRGLLHKDVVEPLIELSAFFRDLCNKTLVMSELDRLDKQIPLILCKLEMIFPPSFFTVMVHLVVHLAYEAKIAGPVQYRWMYFVERDLHTKKLAVRNKAKPEGSIAEAYIAYECLTFCSRYLAGIDTIFNQNPRNFDGIDENASGIGLEIFKKAGRPLGKGDFKLLADDWKQKAHLYILNNCEEVWPYAEKYKSSLPSMSNREFTKRYNAEFPTWFRDHVAELNERNAVSKDLFNLAMGPYSRYKCYSGHIVNGYRFHTVKRQMNRKSQNSGVLSRGDDNSCDKEYYGTLTDVWEIQYLGMNCVYLFQCEWFDVSRKGKGYVVDDFSITSVNASGRLNTNEPFILASQAAQVFYVQDPKKPNWLIVMKNQPRDVYKLPFQSSEDVFEINGEDDAFQEEEITTDFHATRALDDDEAMENQTVIGYEEIPLTSANQMDETIGHDVDYEYDQDETDEEIGDDEDVNVNNAYEEGDNDDDD